VAVSVIVPTFNGARWLGDQLAALAEQTFSGEWELIIADNGSTDDTRGVANGWKHRFPELRLLDTSAIRGQSHARNEAARAASGDVLLFTDQDDIVRSNWISLLADGLADSPIVTGPIEHFVDGNTPSWVDVPNRREPLRIASCDALLGCNMGIERELFLELGGFDVTAVFGWEDIDLGIRAGFRGISITWIEEALILHRRPGSVGETWRREFAYGRGKMMLERRYRGVVPDTRIGRLMRRAGWVAVRAPYVAFPTRRRAWVAWVAGLTGYLGERLRPSG
jgi:glycosyltransferase involved in cell wall biosynthesis